MSLAPPTDPQTARHQGLSPARRGPRGLRRAADFVDRHIVAVFLMPAVVFVVVMMIFPVLYTMWLSFHTWSGGVGTAPEFVGLDNFTNLLTDDPRFWAATRRTFVFTALAVSVETVLGVAIAVIFNREFMGKGLLRTLFLFPMIATPVAIALVWRLMYDPTLGVLNDVLGRLGLPRSDWVASSKNALPFLAVVDVWQWTPLITLMTLAGLSALPSEPFEAAAVDGATGWQTFRSITLPLLRPVIIVAMTFRMIDALKTFDIIFVITEGGPAFASETLNLFAYSQSFQYQNLGYASSLLILFFTIVVGAAVLLMRFRTARERS